KTGLPSIDRHLDRLEDWPINLRESGTQRFPWHAACLSRKNGGQTLDLLGTGRGIDEQHSFAIAFVNRLRPLAGKNRTDASEIHVTIVPFNDFVANNRFTIPIVGEAVELAAAPIAAVTRLHVMDFEPPGYPC